MNNPLLFKVSATGGEEGQLVTALPFRSHKNKSAADSKAISLFDLKISNFDRFLF